MAQNYKYWVWLSSIPGIGPVKRRRLIECFGDPTIIWDATETELREPGFLTGENINQLKNKRLKEEADKIFEKIYMHGIGIITYKDELYPNYLKDIYDPPVVLYYKGKLCKDEKFVAVVGSRKATGYGLKMAEDISSQLIEKGVTVISGMAKGVDSYAHKGALKAGGRTVAVLGCGPDIVYPYENKSLMEQIINSGAIVSEYVPGTRPIARNFPARNRIISGASLGVVVIEAGEKSGSLITADFALEQGREVFALPGNINSVSSVGTNRLIKDGAKVVTCIDDILEEIKDYIDMNKYVKTQNNKKQNSEEKKYHGLDDEEIILVRQLEQEPLHIDILASKCVFSVQTVGSLLVMLELKGVVEQLPGKIFRLIG